MFDLASTRESDSPFHEGEQRIQQALGVRDEMEGWGRQVVRGALPDEHAVFYAQLPFLVVRARDARGRPWATLLAGAPGFAQAPDSRTLEIASAPPAADALAGALAPGADVGLLGIDLHTRRRNRVNGRIRGGADGGLRVDVDQAFGNCPQYIHARQWRRAAPAPQPGEALRAAELSSAQRRRIEAADTFFIASGHRGAGERAAYGMDVSHRGGPAGFVRFENERDLVFPDYTGNNHFNTLGNLVLDPRAGLLFVDFERGGLLQLTGEASIEWDTPDQQRFPGARRLVRFRVDEGVEQLQVLSLRWATPVAQTRELCVVEKVVESDDVTSFLLAPTAGEPLSAWTPGQHLPLEIEFDDGEPPALRTYSLSNEPGSGVYRISVKRDPKGRVSRYLHDEVATGARLRAGAPAGAFGLDLDALVADREVALVGAGIGITPMASMLHALAAERREQPVALVHGVRDGAHHPLAAELRDIAGALPNARNHVRYSRPRSEDLVARDYDDTGHVDAALLARLVALDDAVFYLCGPTAFLAEVRSGLERQGVERDRIHYEVF